MIFSISLFTRYSIAPKSTAFWAISTITFKSLINSSPVNLPFKNVTSKPLVLAKSNAKSTPATATAWIILLSTAISAISRTLLMFSSVTTIVLVKSLLLMNNKMSDNESKFRDSAKAPTLTNTSPNNSVSVAQSITAKSACVNS